MIDIDKITLKHYINTKYVDTYHIEKIEHVDTIRLKYLKEQVPVESRYYDEVKRNGCVYVDMIGVVWYGWYCIESRNRSREKLGLTAAAPSITSDLVTTYTSLETDKFTKLSRRHVNRFNLDSYQEWIIDNRDSKLDLLIK